MGNKPTTLGSFLNDLTLQLKEKRDAEDLLCDLFSFSRSDLYHSLAQDISEEKRKRGFEWLMRRLNGEPLPYISGKVYFYGCDLKITPFVLIPRPETEILVDKVVNSLKGLDLQGKYLWDVCCGSGCIGISLKKRFPDLSVFLSDSSPEALEIALENARMNRVEVNVLKGDLFAPFQGLKAHFVVCNPPYVSEEEYAELDREVKDFEPFFALVPGKSGLEIYERIASELPPYLNPQAKVWLEIGYRQGEPLKKIFQTTSWKNQKVENDWAGHPRFFFLENE